MPRDFSRPHPSLTRDLDDGMETPDGMYAAFRYLDRMLSAPPHKERHAEIAALDVSLLSPRVQYLAWHLIVLQRRSNPREKIAELFAQYPNLRPLEAQRQVVLDQPIVMSADPNYAWSYFTKKNIIL